MSKLTRAEALSLSAGLLLLPSCGRELISSVPARNTLSRRIHLGHGLYIDIKPTPQFPIARPDGTVPSLQKSGRHPLMTVCPQAVSTDAVCSGGGSTQPPRPITYNGAEADGDGGGYIENYVQGVLRSQDTFSSIGTDDSIGYQVVHSTLTASSRIPSANTIPVDTDYMIGSTVLHYNSSTQIATVNGQGMSATVSQPDANTIQIQGNSTTTPAVIITLNPTSPIAKNICKNLNRVIATGAVLAFKAEMEAYVDTTCSSASAVACLEAMGIANAAEAQYEDMMNHWVDAMNSHC